jgi:tetratricopeptide (TPR) repeat protein
MTRSIATIATVLTLTAVHPAAAQSLVDLRRLYDAGQYQQVVVAVGAAQAPDAEQARRLIYLAGQSQQKLSRKDDARQLYAQLAALPESDPWHDIGRSAIAMLDSNAGGAVEAANQAAAAGDSIPEAHFQRGLALGLHQDMSAAAAAFEKATQLDPGWADAHYYAGLAYSKAKRIDQTALHFDTFLRLAPQSPARPEVQSIMRTLSGK